MSIVQRNSVKVIFAMSMFLLLALILSSGAVWPVPAGGDRANAGGGASYYFVGYGRAHGVGMCMDGVYYMAKEGKKYHDILSFYYTGITFSKTDESQPIRVKGRDGQIRVWTMHDYLHHLQEEPDNYPIEELKALYVAARTYTLSCINRNKHAAEGFDICSSGDCCQACDENKNIPAYPNNNAAVDATAGEIMTYNGQPIIAAYCGSCGGHTENNEDVWNGSVIPYLRGKPDPYCCHSSRFQWSVTFSKADVEARLNSRSDTAVGSLYVMDLSSRTPGGRVKTAKLVGSSAVKYVSGSVIERLFGFSSTKFDLVRPNFDEYILVLNPNPAAATVTFTFMKPDGTTSDKIQEVAVNSRFTLNVNECMQFQEVSTRVTSNMPVIAERAMYFNYGNRFNGGSASMGVTGAQKKWYLAEGYTGGNFETYVLVQNPGPNTADIKYTFMTPGGKTPVEKTQQAPAFSRTTLCVNDVPGLENTDVSTVVECVSGDGIIAERSMYFDYMGRDGGHNAMGVPAPAESWHLAEGYTGGGFDTYVLIQNPSGKAASVEATYMKEDGVVIKKTYDIAARSRYTIHADVIPGLENAGFSTMLLSKNGVNFIAERAMYFDYDLVPLSINTVTYRERRCAVPANGAATESYSVSTARKRNAAGADAAAFECERIYGMGYSAGIDDGSDSAGVSAPSDTWYFAEGYTGGRFDTYVLIENPEAKPAEVKATFSVPTGNAVEKSYTIRAHSRFTIHVDEVEGLSNTEVSTTLRSTNGVKVVAERAMYFVYTDGYSARDGGHDTAGTTAPSKTWYFAEGYTGF
ncbi:MAG: hypothetical protein CVT63_01640 [Candidatus Anoxymicrobium japonicum]|uniref:Sporulation stage II protein D amidase enhancer LytB N-terminal domain-containing protein n=1 Tax=Candidatus Anoxymicrobium japonicum TaxID=2013648 RepID=A0A2N3G7P2_9ACTN|nr:MAG: hypothetical protein CVT63_01640 [Candidatus Anoxymicrobium japonicum]